MKKDYKTHTHSEYDYSCFYFLDQTNLEIDNITYT